MNSEAANLHFLVLHKYCLSEAKAAACVIDTLERAGEQCPPTGWKSIQINWRDEPIGTASFSDLVSDARRNGVVTRMQRWLDKKDPIFGGTFNETASPNKMKCRTQYAGWEREVEGPFRSACVEKELVEDILECRSQACHHSNEYDFRLTARHFRAYLSGLHFSSRRVSESPHSSGRA
jgi:hypothetical protein